MKIQKIKTGEYGEKPLTKVRLFVHNPHETLIENLNGRWHRPHKQYKEELLPTVFKFLSLPFCTGAHWNQKAGCSCGCSPGFVLDIHPVKAGFEAIWVTLY